MEAVSNATQQVVDAAKQATTAAANLLVGKKKAIHFGGGNIGRGFVAEFLHKSGYEVVFVDVVDELIERIQNTPSYTVTEIGTDDVKTFKIDNYRAINSKHNEPQVVHEIATADLVTCAVGPNILKFIAPVIAKGIDGREKDTPLAVIACENMVGGTDTLAGFVKEKLVSTTEAQLPDKVRYANSAIDRIVPIQDPDAGLNVKIERFYEWCVDVSPFKGARGGYPPIQGVHFVDDLVPYIERKLYTVNTGHATAAYYGYQKGKTTIHEAMADEEVKDTVHKVLVETAHLIVNKHGIDRNEQKKYVESIVTRISNPHLEDLVTRVGRAPLRKIGRKERFIGPAAELAERGEPCEFLLGATEQLLKFQNVEGDEDSVELAKILKEKSAEEATEQLTGLSKDHPLFPRVLERVKSVQASSA